MTRRLHVWWLSAVTLAATLTTPKVTPATADQPFVDEVRASWLFSLCEGASRILGAAWRDAQVNRSSRELLPAWGMLPLGERVRLAGRSIAVAGVTVLVLHAGGQTGVAPFAWVLPLALVVLGGVAAVAADPIARAFAAKRS